MTGVIKTEKELEFAVFCIENVAKKLNVSAAEVYKLLTEKSDILREYVVPGYGVLHTQDSGYITDDVINLMRKRGLIT